MRISRALYVAAALVLASVLAAAAPRPSSLASPPAQRSARELDPVERQLLALINAHRARARRPPLRAVSLLNDVATRHSQDMARRNFFSHQNPDGRSPFDRMRAAGYGGGAMAENLAAGSADAAGTFRQWRTSPGHNANMLNGRYRGIGLGRAAARSGDALGYYWTAVFGDVAQ